jgi:hypothetical protein
MMEALQVSKRRCRLKTGGWDFRCTERVALEFTLWKTYKKRWKTTMFNGKIHYFYGLFSIAM